MSGTSGTSGTSTAKRQRMNFVVPASDSVKIWEYVQDLQTQIDDLHQSVGDLQEKHARVEKFTVQNWEELRARIRAIEQRQAQ